MLTTSITLHRKAKDGKDGTSVTILSTKVLYQVSASPTDIPTSWVQDIKNAIQTDSKPYLWSKTTVVYSDNKTITTTYSVSYKGKDGTNGTSFTPKGTATGFFYNMSSVPSYEDGMDSDVYIVNVDDRSNPTSELPPYVCRYEYESLVVEHAEFGDGYNVNGHLYVANSDEWVDFGEIQGAKGEKGDDGMDGKDAINIVFSPAELVFDADENGNLKQAEKSAQIKVYRGTTELQYKTDWDNDAEIGDNCRAALLINTTTNKPEVKISGITSSNIDDVKVPATSGGANVSVIVDGVKYRAYLPFSVNVNTYANFLIRDNKKYISKYTEISNKYDAVSSELKNKADLKTVESTIEQTAENIKLEVLSKTSGRRNMLPNSAFRNQDSVFIHSLARIEKNTGVDGVNCIYSSDKYPGTGDGNYIGAFWNSTQKNGVVTNIPIVKGKKYVISCWIRSDNLDLSFVIECFFMNSINQQNRGEDAVRKEYHVDNVNEWKRIDFVVDTTDTSEYASKVTPYLAVNFWSNTKNVPKAIGATDYPTCHAYICKPMMEEGDTYSGWTLSEDDYDYVGGNMIDNARTLEVGGSLTSINASNVSDYGLAYYGDSMSLRINNTNDTTPSIMTFTPSLEVGVDYIFSFMAKGTANVGLYALCDNSVDGDYLLSEDSVNAGVREIDTLKSRYAPIVLIPTQLTTEYKRYWGHMRFYGHVPTKLYLQLNHAGEVYICQPKLEVGATMTEFTERKTDLVDKASLKKAGIEITTNQVKLYGDKVQVLTRKDESSEYVEAGMFVNGKLNANLIDAETINVNHVYARSSEGSNIVGHFGNFDKADAVVGNDKCPLWLGAALAKDAPFRVTKDGSLYASKGIFKGELQGVKGSFNTLTAISTDGKTTSGVISFNHSGYIDIQGDMHFQGMTDGRNGILYGATIWSRGAFGHRFSTFALVVGSMMYVYPYGTGYPDKKIIVYLTSQQYDGKEVYNIPLYGGRGYEGCPIDVVAFKNNTDRSEYYYEFIPGGTGKRWMAVNIRDTNNGVHFCDVGGWHQLNGGETINLVYIQPDLLTPSQENKTYYGRGIFWSGEHDLDWSNR